MKQIVTLLLLISASLCSAQITERKTLTEPELETAKELYVKMMQSETFRLREESVAYDVKMSNGVELPIKKIKSSAIKTENDVRELYTQFMNENISKTNYGNVKDGVEAFMRSYNLEKQMMAENKELYALMARSGKDQLAEILKPYMEYSKNKAFNASRN